MTLQRTLDNIVQIKDGKREFNSKYNPDALYNFHSDLAELQGLNLKTPEDVGKYRALTGEKKLDADTSERMNIRRECWIRGGSSDFFGYSARHFGKLVREISDEEGLIEFASKYCPVAPSKDEEYEGVRKVIHEARNSIGDIKRDPAKFFIEEMRDRLKYNSLPAISYMQLDSDHYLKTLIRDFKQTIVSNLEDYGALKFVKDTKEHYDAQTNELEKIKSEIQESIRKIEREKGQRLNPDESAEILQEARKSSDIEKYEEDDSIKDNFVKECAETALSYIARRREKGNKNS